MNSTTQTEKVILAVDIGGTKIAAAAITVDGRILTRRMVPTLQKGPESGIDQIIRLLEALKVETNVAPEQFIGIGIGIPAALENNTDLIIWGPNLQGWKNVDLCSPTERTFSLAGVY